MKGGNALTPTLIRSQTYHRMHGARAWTPVDALQQRCARNDSHGAELVSRGAMRTERCARTERGARFLARIVQQLMPQVFKS